MRKHFVHVILLAIVLAAFGGVSTAARGAVAAPSYVLKDLGTLPGDYSSVAMGINEFGDVVGWSLGPAGVRAFIYTDATGMSALPSLAGRPVTAARAVNDAGTVVGYAATDGSDIGHAVRWQSGVANDLGTFAAGTYSNARGVNASGVTVGWADTSGSTVSGVHAFRATGAPGLVDLTPTTDSASAEAINDAGQVAGTRNSRAFRLTGSTFTDLGVPTGFAYSFGYAINNAGQVAGHVTSGSGNSERIFRYTDGVGMVLLGGMGEFNQAFGINNAGDVVGWGLPELGLRQGFLYTDTDGMRGLNGLIESGSGWFVLGAGDINDSRQIAGWASGPLGQRAVRLTPAGSTATTPSAPSGLTATVLSTSRVQLNWTDTSSNELGFRVERAVGAQGKFVLRAELAANATTYTDKSVRPGRVYRYRVVAFNAAGSSAPSNVATVP